MENHKTQIINSLKKFLPATTLEVCAELVMMHKVQLTITKHRRSKLGDYRPPQKGENHKITINGSLNPYSFLVTFIHEIAHLVTWEKYQNKVMPHGKEWKKEFQLLMNIFLKTSVFPHSISLALKNYMENPYASSCRDEQLVKALSEFDSNLAENLFFLSDIPYKSIFSLEDGRKFEKGEILRKFYRCKELSTNKIYRISSLTKVKLIQ
ncbi:MAG: SprT-like domain-containing protein [Flammeovirgaceae bacterium]